MPEIQPHNSVVMTHERIDVGRVGYDINHDTFEHALDMCKDRRGLSEIDDSAALGIAAQFQGPGGAGAIFAQLSTTGNVVVGELLDAIAAEYRDPTYSPDVRLMLDMLSTWALNHPTRPRAS